MLYFRLFLNWNIGGEKIARMARQVTRCVLEIITYTFYDLFI